VQIVLYAAAETFSVTPKPGLAGSGLLHHKAESVFSPLKTTVTLIRDEQTAICLITTHFLIEQYFLGNLLRRYVARELDLSPEQVFVFSSHNHHDSLLTTRPAVYGAPRPNARISTDQLTAEGRALLRGLVTAARRIRKRTVPVRVAWNVGHERRITYNRKGRRADGSTYLMREEDRVLLGKDFTGDIEDDAPVVAFVGQDDRPVCFLVQFTGHPATDYHPEQPIVHGDYPQVASDELSAAFGHVPVGFLQGCAGDVNSKGLLSTKPPKDKAADIVRYGRWLGDTYVRAARRLRYAAAEDVAFSWQRVHLPFQKVPSARVLRAQIAEMDDFIRRCAAGDETALTCVGLNTARSMTPRYRSALVEPCRRWAQWALNFHIEHRLASAPRDVELDIAAIRIGDVGIVGLPCEPLLGIGRQIKRDTSLPLVVPCGYMNDQSVAYVPDMANNGDTDYQSSFYRYTTTLLPYKDPAGDLLAQAATRMLREITVQRR
jgi:hypothetical protein